MPLPARAPARIVCVRKSKRGKLPRGGAKDERVPPVCVGRLRCDRCVDGRKWCDRDGAGMQESRPARHALLRRQQRSRRRRADRSEKAGRIHPRWSSPTRRSRIRRSIRTSSSRSPTYLAQCTGKRVIYYPVQSNSAEIEAMRSGRLHVAGFSTGPTGFAVNLAGAVPFAAKGTEKGPQGYHLLSLVKKDSPYQKLSDLKGKRVAHTAPSSNSGHLAPLVLYPPEGLKPNEDYKPLMSGGHDKSALGVAVRRLRHGRRRLRRVRAHGHARHAEGRRLPHHLHEPAFPDLLLRLCARPQAGSRQEDSPPASSLSASRLRCRRNSTATTAFSRSPTRMTWKVVREIAEGVRHALQQGGLRSGRPSARPKRWRRSSKNSRRQSSNPRAACGRHGRADTVSAESAADVDRVARHPQPAQGIPRRRAGAQGRLAHRRGPRHDRDHRPVRAPASRRSSAASTGWSIRPPARFLFAATDMARLDGRELRAARRRIGMVFQEYNLVERLSVIENVLCGRLGYVPVWRAWLRKFPATRHRSRLSPARRRRPRRLRHPARRSALRRPAPARRHRARADAGAGPRARRRADLLARSQDLGRDHGADRAPRRASATSR